MDTNSIAALMDTLKSGRSPESVSWIANPQPKLPSATILCEWVKTDILNVNVQDRFTFCDSQLLEKNITSENELKQTLDQNEQPYESQIKFLKSLHLFTTVGNEFFSSRSSVKFANLDALIQFTNPMAPSGKLLVAQDKPLDYVDITNCSTDFGFIEYVQWRKGKFARGFAFQPKDGAHQLWFKMSFDSRPESELNCQVIGSNRDSEVIRSFIDFVRKHLEHGAHLVCSDGICEAENLGVVKNRQIMEVYFKRYYMCQCIIALSTVATNGTFILKLTHMLTPFMVGLLYLVRLYFRELTIIKPFSSRTCSSEKYAIFRWKLASDNAVLQDHLLSLNDAMEKMTNTDVVELVPLDVIRADAAFIDYIVACNNRTLQNQITANYQSMDYIKTKTFPYNKQMKYEIYKLCLRSWNLPICDETTDPKAYLYQLVYSKNLQLNIIELTSSNADQHLRDICVSEWVFFPCALGRTGHDPTLFLGQGENVVYTLINGTWERLSNHKITLPPGTLIYGQLTSQLVYTDDDALTTDSLSLHIIDVYVIEFNKVYNKSIWTRQQRLHSLVRVENNPQVIGRPITEISNLLKFVQQTRRNWKIIGSKKSLVFATNNGERFYEARGLVMLAGQRNGSETGLLWDWTKNTYDVVNGQGHDLHFGRFEELLAGRTRQTNLQQNNRNYGSRNDRPMIYRNPNNTFNN